MKYRGGWLRLVHLSADYVGHWNNHHLSMRVKGKIYRAIVLSTLLYGAEVWTVYRRQVKKLHAFMMRHLRSIMRITWMDKVTNKEILKDITIKLRIISRVKNEDPYDGELDTIFLLQNDNILTDVQNATAKELYTAILTKTNTEVLCRAKWERVWRQNYLKNLSFRVN